VRKLLALALLACAPALATNFALVQNIGSPNSSSANTSQTFASANTAGNVIVVMVFGGNTSTTVADTQGNTYTLIQAGFGGGDTVQVYAAPSIKAGSNTVTATDHGTPPDPTFAIWIAEYSSANPTYYVCAASQDATGTAEIVNINSGGSYNYVTPVDFTSPSEVMAVFGGESEGADTWSVSAGTLRYQVHVTGSIGNQGAAGDQDVSSMTGSYSVFLYPTSRGNRTGLFLSLTSASGCLGPAPSANTTLILY
jgi:hypothetical protein